MRLIPLAAVPNQSLSVTLGGARWDIRIRVAGRSMVADVRRDGVDIVLGQRIVPGELIVPYPYLLSAGEYVNFGITTVGDEYPWWEQFGDTQRLVSVTAADLAEDGQTPLVWPPLAVDPPVPYEGPSLILDFAARRYGIAPEGIEPPRMDLSDIVTFTRASQATYFDAGGRIRLAENNTPRIDYDPITGAARGLLMERAGTNLISISEDFEAGSWSKSGGMAATTGGATAPDGAPAQKIARGQIGSTFISALVTGQSQPVTQTVFAKPDTANFVSLRIQGTYPARGQATYNLRDGVVSGEFVAGGYTGATGRMVPVGGGWFRCELTVTPVGPPAASVYISCSETDIPVDGIDTSADASAFIWGAQLETGTAATSYIPTEGTPATRAADSAVITDLSGWYNPEQGTLLVEAIPGPVFSNTADLASLVDGVGGSNNNRLQVFKTAGGNISFYAAGQGSGIPTISTGSFDPDTVVRFAFTYPLPTTLYRDGQAYGPTAGIPEPTITQLNIGGRGAGTQTGGVIPRILYFPRRLTDELQALTS